MKISRTYLFSLGTLGLATVLQMGVVLILARGLGPADFGKYSLYASSMAIFIEVCGLGGGDFFIKHGRSQDRNVKELAGFCMTYGFVASIVMAPVLAWIVSWFQIATFVPLLVLAVFSDLFFSRLEVFVEYFYIGLNQSGRANFVRMLFNGLRLAAAGLYFHAYGHAITLESWIYIQAVCSAAAAILIAADYARRIGVSLPHLSLAMMAESFPFGVTQLLRTTQLNFDRLLLGFVLPMEALGAYSAASRFTLTSLTPIVALLRGTVAGFYDNAAIGREQVNRYARRVAGKVLLLTTVTNVALVAGLYVVEFIIGSGYKHVPEIGMALIPSIYAAVLLYVYGDYFNALGLSSVRMYITIIGMLTYIAMVYVLGMTFGLFGVIIAINLSGFFNLAAFNLYLLVKKSWKEDQA